MPESGLLFMDTVINNIPNISVITKIEILGFNAAGNYYQLLADFMDDSVIFDLLEDVVNQSISLRKRHKIKLNYLILLLQQLP